MWDPSFLSKDQTCSHHRGSLESATELSRKSLLICGVCSSVSKESACNAGDPGSIPESGRSPEKEMATHSSILAWKILWAEEPSGLLSMGSQESESAPRQNILHIMPLSVFHLCFTCYALNYKHKVTYQR